MAASIACSKATISGHKLVMQMLQRDPCTLARNEMARLFLESDAMYLMFVDDDTPIPDDAIVRLLALEADIATGVTPFMFGDGAEGLRANVVPRNGDININANTQSGGWLKLWPTGTFDISHCGTSCILLARHVFDVLKFPWFQYYQDAKGGFQTEDVHFCHRARNAGLTMRCDGAVRCGHLNMVDLADFAPSRNGEEDASDESN
jgi:hypothetical protein